jgi:hypothetical protein
MKRVKHFTAVGKHVTMKLTMEITTNKDSTYDRKSFTALVDAFVQCTLFGLAELGFSLTNIKLK